MGQHSRGLHAGCLHYGWLLSQYATDVIWGSEMFEESWEEADPS